MLHVHERHILDSPCARTHFRKYFSLESRALFVSMCPLVVVNHPCVRMRCQRFVLCLQVVQLVQRMAEQLPSNKLQVVFLINNYHEVNVPKLFSILMLRPNFQSPTRGKSYQGNGVGLCSWETFSVLGLFIGKVPAGYSRVGNIYLLRLICSCASRRF